MITCPSCNSENIAGADVCEACGSDLHRVEPVPDTSALKRSILEDPCGGIQNRQIIILSPEDSVADAVEKMRVERRGCVLVEENNKLVGIFTERDVIRRYSDPRLDHSKIPLRSAMTPKPRKLQEEDPVAFALHLMSVGGFIHVPIVQATGPVGMVSVRRVLDHLANKLN